MQVVMYDVAVIGAGPAGSSSALKLAEGGASVALFEKRAIPRYKACGGGIVQRTRRLLTVDIAPVIEREFFTASISLVDRNAYFEVSRDEPLIAMTMRSSFDALLVSAAEKAGARIRPKSRVSSITTNKSHVELDTSSGTIRARFAIVSDGASSVLARAACPGDTRILAPAIETELYLPDKDMGRLENSVRFDFDLSSSGYGWIFPKKGHLSVGVISIRRGGRSISGSLKNYLGTLGINRVEKEERHGFVIPLSPRQDGFSRGRTLLAGDAAGFADPVTAEGISSAVLSGYLAAEALLREGLHEHRSAARYEALVRKHILPELSAGRMMAKLLYSSAGLGTWAFKRYGEKLIHAFSGVFMGERSYRSIWNPANYLRLLREYAGVRRQNA